MQTMRIHSRWLVGASLIALVGVATGCAHTPASPVTNDAKPGTAKVLVTGSRIPRTVDARTGLPSTISPVRIYTREQLGDTGRAYDAGAALRALDPSLAY
jgi:hypothetical protein